jgi:hypothetical protein
MVEDLLTSLADTAASGDLVAETPASYPQVGMDSASAKHVRAIARGTAVTDLPGAQRAAQPGQSPARTNGGTDGSAACRRTALRGWRFSVAPTPRPSAGSLYSGLAASQDYRLSSTRPKPVFGPVPTREAPSGASSPGAPLKSPLPGARSQPGGSTDSAAITSLLGDLGPDEHDRLR